MRPQQVDLLSSVLSDVEALEGAACAGTNIEFVDVTPTHAAHVIASHCRRCTVIATCRQLGDTLAPHAVLSVFGGRAYEPREPADGWPEEVAS